MKSLAGIGKSVNFRIVEPNLRGRARTRGTRKGVIPDRIRIQLQCGHYYGLLFIRLQGFPVTPAGWWRGGHF